MLCRHVACDRAIAAGDAGRCIASSFTRLKCQCCCAVFCLTEGWVPACKHTSCLLPTTVSLAPLPHAVRSLANGSSCPTSPTSAACLWAWPPPTVRMQRGPAGWNMRCSSAVTGNCGCAAALGDQLGRSSCRNAGPTPSPALPSPLRLRSFPPGHAAAEAGGGQGARRCIRCCHRTACTLGFLTFLESAGACWISTVLVCYPNNDSVSLAMPAPPIPLLQGGPDAAKQIHIVSSGLKAGATWHRVKILQDCRECCGGECRLWLATACGWQLRATPACKGWMLQGLRQCVCG